MLTEYRRIRMMHSKEELPGNPAGGTDCGRHYYGCGELFLWSAELQVSCAASRCAEFSNCTGAGGNSGPRPALPGERNRSTQRLHPGVKDVCRARRLGNVLDLVASWWRDRRLARRSWKGRNRKIAGLSVIAVQGAARQATVIDRCAATIGTARTTCGVKCLPGRGFRYPVRSGFPARVCEPCRRR